MALTGEPEAPSPRERRRAVRTIAAQLSAGGHPRALMSLMVASTAAVGFLASWILLRLGMTSMGLRYPLALGLAYLAFLLAIRCWLAHRGRQLERRLDVVDLLDLPWEALARPAGQAGRSVAGTGTRFGGAGASTTFGEGIPVPAVGAPTQHARPGIGLPAVALDLDDGWPLLVLGLCLALLAGAALWTIWAAPGLLAELALDGAVAGGLYHRLARIDRRYWLATALRRTVGPALLLALLLTAVGFTAQRFAPTAVSIGDLFRIAPERS